MSNSHSDPTASRRAHIEKSKRVVVKLGTNVLCRESGELAISRLYGLVEDLVDDPRDLTQEQIRKIEQIALTEPNLNGRLVSQSGHISVINVTVQLPDGDQTQDVNTINQFVRNMMSSYESAYADHAFYYTGLVMMNNAFQTAANDDAQTLIPLMFLTIILVMWLLLRSVLSTIATLLVVILSIIATMGFAGWSGFM